MNLASLPSPSTAVWELNLGFATLPLRAYALCIIAGIVIACVITDRRMRARGTPPWAVIDIAVWAVPFGIIGARIYHVFSSPAAYFGENGDLVKALYIWEGGLGIWGGVAGGALGAYIACRQMGIPFTLVADSIAVGLPVAQAVGRLGNWFNNELYGGRADNLPWGLKVHDMASGEPGRAKLDADGQPVLLEGLYHPTFLYELLWNLGVAGLVLWLDRKFKFGKGRAFALYVMGYTAGRVWIEMLRIDDSDTVVRFLGQRLNVWTSVVVFLGALAYFLLRKGPRAYVLPPLAGDKQYVEVDEETYLAYQADGTRPDAPATDGDTDGGAADDGEPSADAAEDSTEPAGSDTAAGSASAATKD